MSDVLSEQEVAVMRADSEETKREHRLGCYFIEYDAPPGHKASDGCYCGNQELLQLLDSHEALRAEMARLRSVYELASALVVTKPGVQFDETLTKLRRAVHMAEGES